MRLVALLLLALIGTFVLVVGAIVANDLPLDEPPGTLARLTTYLTTHRAETREDSPFPELRPRAYATGASVLFSQVRTALAELPRWRIVEENAAARTVHAVVTSALFGFEDDVIVRVVPEPVRPVVVVRATSRVGRGDLGTNARHVLDVYAALAAHGLRAEAIPGAAPP
jgi:uncharacterized protein (DUF1499 family)